MKQFLVCLVALFFVGPTLHAKSLQRIAFGSCLKESRPAPVWRGILSANPDVFIMMGDNIYGDSSDMKVLREKYEKLFAHPDFTTLRQEVPLLATWDDHDYGANNAGKEFSKKVESQRLFYSFFRPHASTKQRITPGVYEANYFGEGDQVVQVILLDTRYFRDALEEKKVGGKTAIVPTKDKSKTLLGESQWRWLENQLRQPANLRILVSSIEFNGDEHRFEKWYNFPHERERFFKLIQKTKAENLVIISGDRHRAMIAKHVDPTPYPIYEVTASSLNLAFLAKEKPEEINRHRMGASYFDENFGMLLVDWDSQELELQVRNNRGKVVRSQKVDLGKLKLR